jgi:hypothetical protein
MLSFPALPNFLNKSLIEEESALFSASPARPVESIAINPCFFFFL